jgi:hypothetical protein
MNAQKFMVSGFFYNANGEKIEFVSMKMPTSRDRAMTYEREVARKLRGEGCRPILRTRPV